MRRASRACRAPPPASCPGGSGVAGGGPLAPRKLQSGRGAPGRLPVLFLLVFGVSLCKGAPVAPSILQEEKDLQLWNEIDDVCSAYLARDTQLQSSNTLEELCFMVLGLLQKTQGLDEKDHSKRSSVLHPLLQLVPQLHEKRPKRYKVDEELRIPGGIQSRGYFIFRDQRKKSGTLSSE
ncbi:neuromedin-U isoform X2 [Eublepharis macularius]|uniref:Neuromedin-U isoform X2 n=1 Tax=Eublepharis macularius TaxID=481883 RepID=A0AA97JZG6_EUBMA|nr:neuromedin-U isoform X2 [Eublepharis macularius]